MPTLSDAKTLHAGMHQVEKAVQQLFGQAATLRFAWTGGQAGESIPVTEAVTLVVSSPRADGKRVLRESDVKACAHGITPEMRSVLEGLTAELAAGSR